MNHRTTTGSAFSLRLSAVFVCALAVLALRGIPHHWVHDHSADASVSDVSHEHHAGHAHHACRHHHAHPEPQDEREPGPSDDREPGEGSCELCITLQLAGALHLPADPPAVCVPSQVDLTSIETADAPTRHTRVTPPVRGPPLA